MIHEINFEKCSLTRQFKRLFKGLMECFQMILNQLSVCFFLVGLKQAFPPSFHLWICFLSKDNLYKSGKYEITPLNFKCLISQVCYVVAVLELFIALNYLKKNRNDFLKRNITELVQMNIASFDLSLGEFIYMSW